MSRVRGGQVYVEIGADPRKLFRSLQDLNKHVGKVGSLLQGLGTRMTAFGAALTAPLALATRQFAQFDDAIRLTGAVSGAAGADLQKLNDRARELGATTSFTAVQVATLMGELGRAGFKPDEINAMTGAVLNLARATGTDATLSAGIMAATLRQFGLGAADATRAADVLTETANATFNSVESLGEALKYAGPVASSLGMSLEDTAAILGVLGNVGIQGSEAGTALRRLAVISAGAGEELQKIFGVTNMDAAGNLKPLVDILDEINTATASMGLAERTAKMAEAFGLLGITSANVLSQTAGGVRGLADDLQNAEGVAARTAKEMDAGLGGSMRILLSAAEGASLAIGDALSPALQAMAASVTAALGGITEFIKQNQALIVTVAKTIATVLAAGVALAALGTAVAAVTAAIGVVLSPIGAVIAAIGLIAVAVNQATGVFAVLSETVSTTFAGIYEAIVDGDLAGAMDILWAGAYASLVRGLASLTEVFGPWVTFIENTFTFLAANVMTIWDGMLQGLAAGWDGLESDLRKATNFLDWLANGGNLEALNKAVDDQIADRRRERQQAIPNRFAVANETADQRIRDAEARQQAARQEADAAEQAVAGKSRAARGRRVQNDQFRELLKSVEGATTLQQLRDAYQEFDALSANGRLTDAQVTTIEDALESSQERISKGMGGMGGDGAAAQIRGGAAAAQAESSASSADVVGTFSGAALSQLGFSQNLAQKQLDKLAQIEQNTRDPMAGLVAD
jgi:TP901 family phage tail tape measure protein